MTFYEIACGRRTSKWRLPTKRFFLIRHGDDCQQNNFSVFVTVTIAVQALFLDSSRWRLLFKHFFSIRHGDDCWQNAFSRFVTVTIAVQALFLPSSRWRLPFKHFFCLRQNDDCWQNAFSDFVTMTNADKTLFLHSSWWRLPHFQYRFRIKFGMTKKASHDDDCRQSTFSWFATSLACAACIAAGIGMARKRCFAAAFLLALPALQNNGAKRNHV